MNIGLLLPARKKKWGSASLKICSVNITDGIDLVICYVSCPEAGSFLRPGTIKRLRARLDRILEEGNVWPVLAHPDLGGFYQSGYNRFDDIIRKIAISRADEVVSSIRGLGILTNQEILVTGEPVYLERSIEKFITKVKTLNILIPEGENEPAEAERAFAETGIPVHITTDFDILHRVRLWLRFPGDHESFDVLPGKFSGTIVDFGAMKVIDTILRKIYIINIEFSDRIKRRIGQQILSSLEKGVLESFIVAACAEAWNVRVTEASSMLGIRLSFKS